MDSFKEIIRNRRTELNLLLREVSAQTEIDQSIISKFEKGERKPSKEQIQKLAEVYNLPIEHLYTAWQSDKIAYELKDYSNAKKILKVAESKVQYLKSLK
jgi:transcriptional regulator with XRE-family HTH domain